MKIIRPKFEIMTDISQNGSKELKQIELAARTCYKSEDRLTVDDSSARKLVSKLIANEHEAMLEHSQLSVRFIVDRGVSHELVRHRLCSFAQESTRYCNYALDKFDNQLTVVIPYEFESAITQILKPKEADQMFAMLADGLDLDAVIHTFLKGTGKNTPRSFILWSFAIEDMEEAYLKMIAEGASPQLARSILPTCIKTEVVMTTNYREWRNILKLRTSAGAHPDMRNIMTKLLAELKTRIPIIFDDIMEGK